MELIQTIAEAKEFVLSCQQQGKTVGFIPTMGALHEGHVSLVQRSVLETDVTITSIFVNPTQFNNPGDLENYPRTLEADLAKLEKHKCAAVFIPAVEEMYPEKDERVFDFDGLDTVMEGAFRPGHFNGVAQIVSKLFDAIPANKAFFGLKDFQQLAIVKHMVKQLALSIEIVPCPIVREADGLAMSSRNARLTADHRQVAPLIYKVLQQVQEKAAALKPDALKEYVEAAFAKEELLELEYFEIVDDLYLKPLQEFSVKEGAIGCIAVWAGDVRLIDNVQINS